MNPSRTLLAFQIVQICSLLALVWKTNFYLLYFRFYYSNPLHQDFFPAVFRSAEGLIAIYLLCVGMIALSCFQVSATTRRISVWIAVLALGYLMVHQGVYNDVTFTTIWWTQLWALWYQSRMAIGDATALARGAFLGRLIISLMLLGGAVGKWTAEYWSGQALWEIYYLERDFWFFNLQRRLFDAENLRQVATWYSRGVVVSESLFGLGLWLLPNRLGSILAILMLSGIAIFSTFYLFSVLLSLIGLALVGLMVPGPQSQPAGR